MLKKKPFKIETRELKIEQFAGSVSSESEYPRCGANITAILQDSLTITLTTTLKQIDGSSIPIRCPEINTIKSLKQRLTQQKGYEQKHFKFFMIGNENSLKNNFVLDDTCELFIIPYNPEPIPDKNTLQEFIKNVVNGTFTEEHVEEYGTISEWDVSLITDMSELFMDLKNFNEEINNWDVSNVTNMKGMFKDVSRFNQSINNWDVSNVIDMSDMFSFAIDFNQPINDWDVLNVTNMFGMFRYAMNFNQSINDWNVSKVIDMGDMFFYAINFNQPINDWDVLNVTDMYGMFRYAMNFNQPINKWNVSNVTDMSNMFMYASNFNQPVNDWNVSNDTFMTCMFYNAQNFNQELNMLPKRLPTKLLRKFQTKL